MEAAAIFGFVFWSCFLLLERLELSGKCVNVDADFVAKKKNS